MTTNLYEKNKKNISDVLTMIYLIIIIIVQGIGIANVKEEYYPWVLFATMSSWILLSKKIKLK